MKTFAEYNLADLKLIYQMLHEQLPLHPELMDSDLLHDLQVFLQQQARHDGVDVSLHAQWASWLNNGAVLKGL